MELPNLKTAIASGFSGILKGAGDIISKFKADPTKVVELESDLEKLRIQAEQESEKLAVQIEEIRAKELETVNQTMREEAKSEHWAVWLWRPTIGFTFCAILINNYILLPYLKSRGMEVIVVPDNVWNAVLVILGVASAGRSVTSWQKAKSK